MSSTEQISNTQKEDVSKLTPEQRLKALLFQYSKLYARWAEDREEFNSGMANYEEALKDFTQKIKKLEEQISRFEQLEPKVRQKLVDAIKDSIDSMVGSINGKIGHSVTAAIEKSVKKLDEEIEAICRAVALHREEMQGGQIKTFLLMMGVAVASSLLIVYFLIPKPIMPLSGNDMHTYLEGQNIQLLWPKLPRRTQIEIDKSGRENFGVGFPFGDLTPRDNGNGGEWQQSGDNTGG